jgi:hypothetical protein
MRGHDIPDIHETFVGAFEMPVPITYIGFVITGGLFTSQEIHVSTSDNNTMNRHDQRDKKLTSFITLPDNASELSRKSGVQDIKWLIGQQRTKESQRATWRC